MATLVPRRTRLYWAGSIELYQCLNEANNMAQSIDADEEVGKIINITTPKKTIDFLGVEKGAIEELIHEGKKWRLKERNQLSREAVGAAVVVTNSFCAGKPTLKTPSLDIQLMRDLLAQKLGFVTLSKELPRTLDFRNAQKIFADISRLELDQFPSFVLYYSGHGDESGILLPSGHVLGYREVIDSVCWCRSLMGKPKLFIFDCSRSAVVPAQRVSNVKGEEGSSIGREDPARGQRLSESDLPPDCLVVFAAGHRQEAVGHPAQGSHFTQNFVQTLAGCIDDFIPVNLEDALASVCKLVREFVVRIRGYGRPQNPELLSTLRTPVMLPALCYSTGDDESTEMANNQSEM